MLQALAIIQIINFFSEDLYPQSLGYAIISLHLLHTLVASFLLNYTTFRCHCIVTSIRGIVTELLDEELLGLHSSVASNQETRSTIISIISSDIEILEASNLIMYLFSCPLFMIGSFMVMYFYLGVAGIVGMITGILQVPLVYCLSKPIENLRDEIAEASDRRVNAIINLIEAFAE